MFIILQKKLYGKKIEKLNENSEKRKVLFPVNFCAFLCELTIRMTDLRYFCFVLFVMLIPQSLLDIIHIFTTYTHFQ